MKKYHRLIGPFQRSKNKTSSMMFHVIIALFPIIVFSFYKNGIIPYIHHCVGLFGLFYPLIFIAIPPLVTCLTEWIGASLFLHKKNNELKEYMKNSYAILPGLFLSLILPIHTPISILIFGSIIATVIGKMVYGGFGNNIFNPALVGRLFVITAYAGVIANHGGYFNAYEMDTISRATPLSNTLTIEGIGTYETVVKPYGNLWNFFTGMIPGAVGETSSLLCILGFIYLTWKKVIKWRIPVCYIGTVFFLTMFIGLYNGLTIWYPVFQILSGGLFFGAIFMATDPVTSPVTQKGQILYGILLGILTVIFRYLTSYPEGVLTSILTMNMFVFIVDKISIRCKRRENQLILIATILVTSGFVTYTINTRYNVHQNQVDPNFVVLEEKQIGNQVLYKVSQKGNGGPITCEVTIQNGSVTKLKVIEHNETPSYYAIVEKENYIDTLIKNQHNIAQLDTVSGATISSTAFKKLVMNTLQEYEEHYEK